ncbi:hypothetical protein BDN71DRAFT_1502918 [Pleurotus eryngii]|uniref:Uncharacterized protein n=1 Tax=Pleurotus eryngii TaxID=5323 RepID=A0A9P6A5V6_PLEER|nr:hypothetical protein BDN71DRAFT_1502918 [Pleurotus eryngii]
MDPVGIDPRWEVFVPFHTYLLSAFPLDEPLLINGSILRTLASSMVRTIVDADPSAKVNESGGEALATTRVTIETLLANGFGPARTVVQGSPAPNDWFSKLTLLAQGAGHLGTDLAAHYGECSFAMVVDE